jgi:hypothetical protein
MKKLLFILLFAAISTKCFCWGFFGHQHINYYAVFLLPPEMMVLYKPNLQFITDHSVDPDKRRYAVAEEAPRHYIDIDNYGTYPYPNLPRKWNDVIAKFGEDTVQENGIVPWWVQVMQQRLTNAFKEKNQAKILKLSAEIGHYLADAHVPLHASSNHDGQFTNQKGIHGFWESRVPELLADKEFDYLVGKAAYIKDVEGFIWTRVLESAAAADTVLRSEAQLSKDFPGDKKYAFEERNGKVVRQYSAAFTTAYDRMMNGMVERRMRQAIYAVASFWYTAWVNAGQPDLKNLQAGSFSQEDAKEFELLNNAWKNSAQKGRQHDEGTGL